MAQLAKMALVCHFCALFGKKASQERLASRISALLDITWMLNNDNGLLTLVCKVQAESWHIFGRLNACVNSVYQAHLHFSHVLGTRLILDLYTQMRSRKCEKKKEKRQTDMTREAKHCRETCKKQVYQNLCIVSHKLFPKNNEWKWIPSRVSSYFVCQLGRFT